MREYNYGVTGKDRKNLVAAVSEILGTESKYHAAPNYEYTVGDYTVTRDGTLLGLEDISLIAWLRQKGFELGAEAQPEADIGTRVEPKGEAVETEAQQEAETDPVTIVEPEMENAETEIKKIICTLENKKDAESDMILSLIYCGLYAGLRLKEAKTLKREDVFFKDRTIKIEPKKTSENDPNKIIIPLSEKFMNFCLNIFDKYPKDIYVVPNISDNERWGRNARISHLIVSTLKALGATNSGHHTCRHTFVSNLANNPKIKDIDAMDYARIKNIEVLKAYRHITPETHINNIDSLTY